jgi:aurora kinase
MVYYTDAFCKQKATMYNCKLEDFKIYEDIGKGTYGKIHLAKYLDHEVAIKYIDLTIKGSKLKFATSEIEIHQTLIHPNIIALYASIDDSKHNKMYIVMEYMNAHDLWYYIEHPLNIYQVTSVLKNVAYALSYCHENNIMHRDVKLENVLYVPAKNIVKLLDFGFARTFKTACTPEPYMYCGTIEYQAYEMVDGKPYDERVDIWAMGVIYYELATLDSPFGGDTSIETCRNIKTKKLTPDLLAGQMFELEIWDIVLGLLERDVKLRMSIHELLFNVEPLLKKIEIWENYK